MLLKILFLTVILGGVFLAIFCQKAPNQTEHTPGQNDHQDLQNIDNKQPISEYEDAQNYTFVMLKEDYKKADVGIYVNVLSRELVDQVGIDALYRLKAE